MLRTKKSYEDQGKTERKPVVEIYSEPVGWVELVKPNNKTLRYNPFKYSDLDVLGLVSRPGSPTAAG